MTVAAVALRILTAGVSLRFALGGGRRYSKDKRGKGSGGRGATVGSRCEEARVGWNGEKGKRSFAPMHICVGNELFD